MEELDEALEHIKAAKTAGVHEVAPEILKYMKEKGKSEMLNILNKQMENKHNI